MVFIPFQADLFVGRIRNAKHPYLRRSQMMGKRDGNLKLFFHLFEAMPKKTHCIRKQEGILRVMDI